MKWLFLIWPMLSLPPLYDYLKGTWKDGVVRGDVFAMVPLCWLLGPIATLFWVGMQYGGNVIWRFRK